MSMVHWLGGHFGHQRCALLLATLTWPALASQYECPSYDVIVQPSVSPDTFSIDDFAGSWYMVATTEPTLPAFCKCSEMLVHIEKPTWQYHYTVTAQCFGRNFSLTMAGNLSHDASRPGLLHETAEVFNHTIAPLVPNMIFDAHRDNTGSVDMIWTYACLGTILGRPWFSFNMLARRDDMLETEIQSSIVRIGSVTKGLLDLGGVRITDDAGFRSCGVSESKSEPGASLSGPAELMI